MIGCRFMWKSEDLQGFFPVRSECQSDVPRTRFKSRVWSSSSSSSSFSYHHPCVLDSITFFLTIQVGKTLSRRRWHAAFTKDGHLDMERVLRRIQRGVSLYLYFNLSFLVYSFVVHFDTSPGDSSINQRRGLGVSVRWLRSRQHV